MTACLTAVLEAAFALLAEGAADAASPFHTPALAGVAKDGGPDVRTVVLRGFDAASRCLEMHTDARSAKVGAFRRRPSAALHGWDPARRVQLRLRGRVDLHVGDASAAASWARLHAARRATYCVAPAPGCVIETPHATHAVNEDAGFYVFCAIHLHFDELEWLHLEHGNHERARFRWDNGFVTPMWLVP